MNMIQIMLNYTYFLPDESSNHQKSGMDYTSSGDEDNREGTNAEAANTCESDIDVDGDTDASDISGSSSNLYYQLFVLGIRFSRVVSYFSGVMCDWCHSRPGSNQFSVKSNDKTGNSSKKSFCSELCFSHSRRAAFKKNKACDWCSGVPKTSEESGTSSATQQGAFIIDNATNLQFCR